MDIKKRLAELKESARDEEAIDAAIEFLGMMKNDLKEDYAKIRNVMTHHGRSYKVWSDINRAEKLSIDAIDTYLENVLLPAKKIKGL